jgi:hypothetical protein
MHALIGSTCQVGRAGLFELVCGDPEEPIVDIRECRHDFPLSA